MRAFSLFLLVATVYAIAMYTVAQPGGGWREMPKPDHPFLVDLGKFAVQEHKSKENLEFKKIVSARESLDLHGKGLYFELILDASPGFGKECIYNALVFIENVTHKRELVSFDDETNPPTCSFPPADAVIIS
ncbi:multicystatin-like [Phragmites australis]|uniref:multicystatin-like n=1 Tax=Phragmites australis TaxID=29695 RepID=UPI002D7673D6|nr:multicystatin-like [Phragmites australis]